MHASALSEVFWEVALHFYDTKRGLLINFRNDLLRSRAIIYSECIPRRSDAAPNCFGFLDGTKVKMCRPGGNSAYQRSAYSGHKRYHCPLYQTVSTTDGLIFHLYEPIEGRKPDSYLYRMSSLEEELKEHPFIEGVQYYLYADGAYVSRPWLQVAFTRHCCTPDQVHYNRKMIAVRTWVEWSYGEVKQYSTTHNFSRKLSVRKMPIAVLYICAVLLRNFKACLKHGGQAPNFFNCSPLTLAQYCNDSNNEIIDETNE